MIGYGRQSIDDADIAAVVDVLKSDYLTQGPAVEKFETALAERVGARQAVAVSSGTAALHIACLAADLGPNDEAVVPTLTFAATANAARYCGAHVRLADVDAETLTLPANIEARSSKVVLPVHFAGLPADVKGIRKSVGKDVIIIEDACQALGGTDEEGHSVGSCAHSDMTVFSFHPVKNITTAEGGAITTNDDGLARKLRELRTHGMVRDVAQFKNQNAAFEADGTLRPWYHEQQSLGFNYRLTDLQAALGVSQLKKLDGFLARRREISAVYDQRFAGMKNVSLPQSNPKLRLMSGQHLYLLAVDFKALGTNRSAMMQKLKNVGIGTQVHYIPVHYHPYHEALGDYHKADFPVAERHYQTTLSIPLFPSMTDEDVDYVSENIVRILI